MLHQYHQLEVPTLKGVCLFDLTLQIKALVLKAGIRWGPRSVEGSRRIVRVGAPTLRHFKSQSCSYLECAFRLVVSLQTLTRYRFTYW
jgi:hypothetical protein